jgi:peptidoglycan/LPS O-acetylase OafA/YrhL
VTAMDRATAQALNEPSAVAALVQKTAVSPTPPAENRVPALDGLRGAAILLVMAHHFVIYSGLQKSGAADRLFRAVAYTGWSGVDLFFVLSGFLITGILLDAKGRRGYFRNFYMRRFLRIFPLYYGFLLMFFVVLPALFPRAQDCILPLRDQLWYWSHLTNVEFARNGWPACLAVGHLWSLAVEEQFYLVWPAVVLLTSPRALKVACLSLVAISLLTRIWLALDGQVLAAYVLMPARFDTLAIGGLLALVARGPGGLHRLTRYAWPAAGVAGALLLVMAGLRQGLGEGDPVVVTAGFTLLGILFGATLVIAMTSGQYSWVNRILTSRQLMAFGRYSYALYIFHQPVSLFLRDYVVSVQSLPRFFGSQLPAQFIFMLLAGSISFALAWLSWHLYEQHFLKLKRFFPYRPEPAPAGE